MILPDFVLTTRRNKVWTESGLDSKKHCLDKKHFDSYPYAVEYRYNSRGYRDSEWPETIEELKQCIWCVGDSFTVGLGSPLAHTWVNILQQRTGIRCINVSMDGASNEWIVRKINRILEEIDPQRLVVQWSYFHRGEDPKSNLTDEERRIWFCKNNMSYYEQLTNFKNIQSNIKNSTTQIVQSCIPNNQHANIHDQYKKMINKLKGTSWPDLINITIDEFYFINPAVKKELEDFGVLDIILEYLNTKQLLTDKNILSDISQNCILINQIDIARDGHHYDYLTAGKFVDSVINRFNISSS
jgi:hypothetical protein